MKSRILWKLIIVAILGVLLFSFGFVMSGIHKLLLGAITMIFTIAFLLLILAIINLKEETNEN